MHGAWAAQGCQTVAHMVGMEFSLITQIQGTIQQVIFNLLAYTLYVLYMTWFT